MSYTGMSEALGRSQVIPYVKILSSLGFVHLVSYEKNKVCSEDKTLIEEEFKGKNITWTRNAYHKRPRVLATLFDIFTMCYKLTTHRASGGEHYVHCRGYVASLAALVYGTFFSRVRYIFDMRAFWPDEMVTSGTLSKRSITYAALKILEKILIDRSHATIVLTHAARDYLISWRSRYDEKVVVVPTCVDHSRFRPDVKCQPREITIGTFGTVYGSWFLFEEFCNFIVLFSGLAPRVSVNIVTHDDHVKIRNALIAKNINVEKLSIYHSSHENMPNEIRKFDAIVMFFSPGFSKLGSAPTRFGEALASGVPCVVNSGVGDMGAIIRKEHVGVVVEDFSNFDGLRRQCLELLGIINRDISEKCRLVSKKYFSLDIARSKYKRIYNR